MSVPSRKKASTVVAINLKQGDTYWYSESSGHSTSGTVRVPDARRCTTGGNMGRIPLLQRFLLFVIESGTECLTETADMAIAMRPTTVVRWALLPGTLACETSSNVTL